MTGPLLVSCVRFLEHIKSQGLYVGAFLVISMESLILSNLWTPLNRNALGGPVTYSEVDIRTAAGTQHFLQQGRQLVSEDQERQWASDQILVLYHHDLQLSSHMAKTFYPTKHKRHNTCEYHVPSAYDCELSHTSVYFQQVITPCFYMSHGQCPHELQKKAFYVVHTYVRRDIKTHG